MPVGPIGAKALDIGAGIITDTYNWITGDARNKKMLKRQEEAAKRMANYNKQIQLDIWNATNYPAQVAQLQKAGLNPGLLYGMSGGGATTTGSSNMPLPDVPKANIGMGIGTGSSAAELALLNAQRENIEADTQLKKVDAAKKGGVDTEESKARIASLTQGIQNQKALEAMQRVETELKNLELKIQGDTFEARADYIEYVTRKMFREVQIADDAQYVSHTTRQDRVNTIKAELAGIAIANELKQAQIGQTKSQTELNHRTISNAIQQNMREWDKMSQTDREIHIKKMVADWTTDPVTQNHLTKLIDGILISPKIR